MGYFADILGTLRSTFRVNKATLDASALTAARSFALPNVAGTLALTSQLGGAVTATVDFGSQPVDGATFTIADAAALTTSRITMSVSAAFPDGREADELEMDGITASAACLANGVITACLTADPGPVSGQYGVLYTIG